MVIKNNIINLKVGNYAVSLKKVKLYMCPQFLIKIVKKK